MKSIGFFIAGWMALGLCAPPTSAVDIDRSDYRIAISCDGHGDHDDISAIGMALALIGEAGLQERLIHFDYYDLRSPDDSAKGKINAVEIPKSIYGGLKKWEFPASLTPYNCQTQEEAAIRNFIAQAKSGGPVCLICAGSMEMPWQCINALPKNRRSAITCISHSKWNDEAGKGHHWDDIQKLGCKMVHISDQNKNAFKSKSQEFEWLKGMGGKYAWLFERNKIAHAWDASDAGITFYVITGCGIQQATMDEIKSVFLLEMTRSQ